MITNPSTLGLFETRIGELLEAVHAAGALAYMDGANLNAMLGRFQPGAAGFDVMHFNVHKTFSTPARRRRSRGRAGRGGGDAGPVSCPDRWSCATDGTFRLERPASARRPSAGCARSSATSGSSCARTPTSGPTAAAGLREVSDDAVLAANYLQHRLAGTYDIPFDAALHARVRRVGARPSSAATGVRTLDVAKRLIDYGFHPPTIYFPLTVEEGMLIEPTETEIGRDARRVRGRHDRDRRGGARDPELVTSAPHTAPVRRLDEATAARQPNLRWRPMTGAETPAPIDFVRDDAKRTLVRLEVDSRTGAVDSTGSAPTRSVLPLLLAYRPRSSGRLDLEAGRTSRR